MDALNCEATIHSLFEEQARLHPEYTAAFFGNQAITYAQLNQKANQLAHYLLTLQIKPDTPVAFCMERSVECLISMLAILKAGAAYLPLDPSHPEERLLSILKHSGTPCLITHTAFKEKLRQFKRRVILLDQDWQEIETQEISNPDLLATSRQLAYLIYTSGSTGVPKGVLIEHRSLVNYCLWFADYSKVQPGQRVDFSSNHTFDMAVTVTIAPLVLCLGIVVCEEDTKTNPGRYLQYLNQFKINLVKMTPSFFKVLLQEVKNKYIALPFLKTIILGGENLGTSECKSWLELYPATVLYNEYGPTETTVGVSQHAITHDTLDDSIPNVPIGRPGQHIHCVILDSDNQPVVGEESGELHIGGLCLARGYLNEPELTRNYFITSDQRLYKTGDLCRLRKDNILEYLGRIDSQVKIRGFRIEPGEIEKHLSTFPHVNTVAVVAQKDGFNENRLVAYYILQAGSPEPTQASLRHYLKNYLPEYMIPSAFISVQAFPLTANGKLQQTLLPLAIPVIDTSHYKKPVTRLEKKLAKIWSEELGVKNVGLEDEFFELGGHSLSAARIVSKINKITGKDLGMSDFYGATTIARLSSVVSKAKKEKPEKQGIQFKDLSRIPLGDFQFTLWITNIFQFNVKKLNISIRKRFSESLDKRALEFAFEAVLKKQEVFLYRISKLRPLQVLQKNLSFEMEEINLQNYSLHEVNHILEQSMDKLINYHAWPKNKPLIFAKLFYLENNNMELHITMPHIVCDDISPGILLNELSQFYLLYTRQSLVEPRVSTPYKDYVFNEHLYFQNYLHRDFDFWNNYLQDTSLFKFSEQDIECKMSAKKIPYSTYTQVPENKLNFFKELCEKNNLSISEGLCALVVLALNMYSDEIEQPPRVCINLIKSTRTNEAYDETIGCFLRLEPMKIALNKASTFHRVIQDIHQSIIDTSSYQQSSNIIKLSSISTFKNQEPVIGTKLLNLVAAFYTFLLPFPKITEEVFKLCLGTLASFRLSKEFLININIQNSFISPPKDNSQLFGIKTMHIVNHHYDLLEIDNVLDICFKREENGPLYLVISANLRTELRQSIADEILGIMQESSIFQV